MNSVMDAVLNTEEQVRLLKDKVRELELQNKQLMNNQQSPNKKEANTKDIKQARNMSMSDEGNEKMSETESVESLGILDVDELLPASSDETWLTDGPVKSSTEEGVLSAVRRNSSQTLDKLVNKPDGIYQSAGTKATYDSRTFTRPRKRRPTLEMRKLPTISTTTDQIYSQWEPKPNSGFEVVSVVAEDNGTAEKDKNTTTASPQPPVVDVHEIARLQEESLKQNSPMSTPKRSSVSSLRSQDSRHDSTSDNEVPHENTARRVHSDVSMPGRVEKSRVQTPPLPPPVQREEESSSAGSSPYGSNSSLHRMSFTATKGTTRRSFPNLSRAFNGTSSIATGGPSSSKLRQPLSSRLSGGISSSQQELRMPSKPESTTASRRTQERASALPARPSSVPDRRRTIGTPAEPVSRHQPLAQRPQHPCRQMAPPPARDASVTHQRTPQMRGNQEQQQQLPPQQSSSSASRPVRSGLPRLNRIPQLASKRSGIPAPCKTSAIPTRAHNADEDWSDGCY